MGKYIKEHPDLSQAAVIKAFGKDQDEYEVIAERTVRDAIRLGFKYGELISQEHAVGKAMKLRWCGSDPAGGEQP